MRRSIPWVLASGLAVSVCGQQNAAQQHADRALELAQRGDLRGAESELRKAVELSPGDAALLTSLGGILAMQGELTKANAYLEKAVRLNPQDPVARRNLAANQWQLGRLAEAHQNLDWLLKQDPRDSTATYLLGMVSEREGHYASAIQLLESIGVQHPESLVAMASSYYHTGRPGQAAGVLRDLLNSPAKPDVLLMAGRVALDAGETSIAEAALSKLDSAALKRLGHDAEQTCLRLSGMLGKHGDYPAALSVLSKVADVFPESYEALRAKGAAEMRLSYYSQAAASYGRALDLHPSAEAARSLALAEWRAGDKEKAAGEFERAMRQYPRDGRIPEDYGALLLEDASVADKTRALTMMKQALTLDDSLVEARYQLANEEMEEGRLESARDYLIAALKHDPRASRLHFALSRVYRRLGRDAEAASETEQYQKLKAAEHP